MATIDPFPVEGIDHVKWYVGNAKQAMHCYRAYGFSPVAYRGLETGSRDVTSWCLRQGRVTFLVSGALGPDHPIAEHVRTHGDGVRDIALRVPNAVRAYELAVARGAREVLEPRLLEDRHGVVVHAAIAAFGDTIHSLIERADYAGAFMPGYQAIPGNGAGDLGVEEIDHVAINVELGAMDELMDFYAQVLGFSEFQHFSDEDVSTDWSALMTKVATGGSEKVKLPIVEPTLGKRKSQIQEFLDYYRGEGVQHVALSARDGVRTVTEMRRRGVEFLRTPPAYYRKASERVPAVADKIDVLEASGLLVDKDEDGYLLQIFAKPIHDRPTGFMEIIERQGARGFGAGNIKALFEAVEEEQALRGNL